MAYKDKFFEDRKKDLTQQYNVLRAAKKTRKEALEILQPIFDLTPESMKVIMSNKNYNKKPLKKKRV